MIDGWFYYSNYNKYRLQNSIIKVNEYKELNHLVFGLSNLEKTGRSYPLLALVIKRLNALKAAR
jgi:hypothetical protein